MTVAFRSRGEGDIKVSTATRDRCPSMETLITIRGLGGILHFRWLLQGFFSCPFVYLDLPMSSTPRSLGKTLIPETKRKHTDPLDLVRCPGGPTELRQASFSILRA